MTDTQSIYTATQARILGLSSRDLSEIGGFSDRFARDLLAHRRPFPADVVRDVHEVYAAANLKMMKLAYDSRDGQPLPMYASTDDLRSLGGWKDYPCATGPFIGPYRYAVFDAITILERKGVSWSLDLIQPE